MDELQCPPWEKDLDEKIVPDGKNFALCHKVVDFLVKSIKAQMSAPEFSLSPEWGYILRARLLTKWRGHTSAALMTCWERDSEARIFLEFPRRGG